jgi:hypothetical protein
MSAKLNVSSTYIYKVEFIAIQKCQVTYVYSNNPLIPHCLQNRLKVQKLDRILNTDFLILSKYVVVPTYFPIARN